MESNFSIFIDAINEETDLKIIKEEENVYSTDIDFEDTTRKQRVLIKYLKDQMKNEIVTFYSIICPLPQNLEAEFLKQSLMLNASFSCGSISIQDEHLIMFYSYFFQGLEPEQFIKTLLYIAAKADELEEVLVKQDRF